MVLKPSSDSEHNREALHFRLQHKSKKQECGVNDTKHKLESNLGHLGRQRRFWWDLKDDRQAHSCSVYFPMFEERWLSGWDKTELATTAGSGGNGATAGPRRRRRKTCL